MNPPASSPDASEPSEAAAPSGASGSDDTAVSSAGPTPLPSGSKALSSPVAPGEIGTLGPYRIIRHLGEGGMGAVYAAVDTRLNRQIAMKVMLPRFAANAAARQRFLREARAAGGIKHDHVVTVYEVDERQGIPYIAMEYLEGCSLDEYLANQPELPIPLVLHIGRQVAQGLAAAHKVGLVHRDIKPANLWLEAPDGRVKVLDFGLARPISTEVELTSTGEVMGTPAYMSPEQARGERVDHRTDLFSLGAVLYRLCTGTAPFPGRTTLAVLMALGTKEPTPVRELNPSVPEPLTALIHQLLAKDSAARPQSAEEVVKRIREISGESAFCPPQPEFVCFPIQTSVPRPKANSSADPATADTPTADELTPIVESEPAAEFQAPARKKLSRWSVAGLVVLLAVAAAGMILMVKSDDADRKAAKYVLWLGGSVSTNHDLESISAWYALPLREFSLTGIDLSGDEVTDSELLTFVRLHFVKMKDPYSLSSLSLRDANITDAGLGHLRGMIGLRWLWLDGTKVTDAGLEHLKYMTGLVWLDLDRTKATDIGLEQLKELKGLKYLYLSGTKVTDIGLKQLKELTELERLDVSGTQVTTEGLADFRAAVPNCKVKHNNSSHHVW